MDAGVFTFIICCCKECSGQFSDIYLLLCFPCFSARIDVAETRLLIGT